MLTSFPVITSMFQITRGKLAQFPSTFCYELRLLNAMETTTRRVGYLSKGYQRKLETMGTTFDNVTSDIEIATQREKETTLLINLLRSK